MKNALELLSILLCLVPDLHIRGVTGAISSWLTGEVSRISASVHDNFGRAHTSYSS
jgi:hypothetical protein